MEQTIGKRIASCRKALGLTQDQLAEQLGVTAQAVSKWENDQSCPDIATLPRLADIFSCTVDSLLGREAPLPPQSPPAAGDGEPSSIHVEMGSWEMRWDAGRRNALTLALMVLLTGLISLVCCIFPRGASFWDILWPTFLITFGFTGFLRRFSLFRLLFVCTGIYYLAENLNLIPETFPKGLLLPILAVILGTGLLIGALRGPRRSRLRIHRGIKNKGLSYPDSQVFTYDSSFGSGRETVSMSRLHKGSASVGFGEYVLDLCGVEELAEDAALDVSCGFGELTVLVPRRFLVKPLKSASFAQIKVVGHPDPQPQGELTLRASCSFGEMNIEYI